MQLIWYFMRNECWSVARFLKDRSSVTPVTERDHQPVNVSLEIILEGKRRIVCAWMVFEIVSFYTFLTLLNWIIGNSHLEFISFKFISYLDCVNFLVSGFKDVCSLVDVKQENLNSDVVLTVIPKLSNELFSIWVHVVCPPSLCSMLWEGDFME